jgi:hypothetical protein
LTQRYTSAAHFLRRLQVLGLTCPLLFMYCGTVVYRTSKAAPEPQIPHSNSRYVALHLALTPSYIYNDIRR